MYICGVADFADQFDQWYEFDVAHNKARVKGSKETPMFALMERVIFKAKYDSQPQMFLDASPLYHARRHTSKVAFLIAHGAKDIAVPIRDAKLLAEHLSPDRVTFFEVPGAHHSFDVVPSPRCFAMLDTLAAWLTAFEQASDPMQNLC